MVEPGVGNERRNDTQGMASAAARLVDVLYVLLWLVLALAVMYGIVKGRSPLDLDLAASLVLLVLFSLAWIRRPTRLLACVAICTLAASFYMFELYLALMHPMSGKAAFAAGLRRQGVPAYPAVFPHGLVELWNRTGAPDGVQVNGHAVLPLSGIPDVPTVYCRADDGEMIVYQSDALGFRNPPQVQLGRALDLALLGDSYVQGFCVADGDTYGALLSSRGHTVSFGMNGTSALAQFAIYREYVLPLRPERVLWFFFEGNDLPDFQRELGVTQLRAYLDPRHSQDLVARNHEVALATRDFIDRRLGRVAIGDFIHEGELTTPLVEQVKGFVLLRNTRAALMMAQPGRFDRKAWIEKRTTLPREQWAELAEIWERLSSLQREGRGDVVFVYVPSALRFEVEDPTPFRGLETRVRNLWSELGVEHLSLTGPVAALEDPSSVYSRGHFTAEGYRLTARYLRDQLDPAGAPGAEPAALGGR